MNFDLKKPCEDCPFRNDKEHQRGWLGEDRASEIERSLSRHTFPCHKTTKHDDDGNYQQRPKEQHCAGALIMLEHMEQPSQMMRIAERLGMYDRAKLEMDSPVFEDDSAFVEWHSEQ